MPKSSITAFLVAFILTNLFTLRIESISDGNNYIGFPFRFYTYQGGKIFPEPISRSTFSVVSLTIDILVTVIISEAIIYFIKKKK
jgi:hypothetical protein